MRNDAVQDHFLHGSPVGDAGSNPLGLVLAATQKKAVTAEARPLYIQQPNNNNNNIAGSNNPVAQLQPDGVGGAFNIFHQMLTEGPENTSPCGGKSAGLHNPRGALFKIGIQYNLSDLLHASVFRQP